MTEQSLRTGGQTGKGGRGSHPNSLAGLKPTQFRKGRSGNPSGRPKDKIMPAVLKALTDEDVARVAELFIAALCNGSLPHLDRYWDRTVGKPRQAVDVNTDEVVQIRLTWGDDVEPD